MDAARSTRRLAPWLPRRLTLGSSRLIMVPAALLALIIGFPVLLAAKGGDIPYPAAVIFIVFAGLLGGIVGATLDSGRTLVGRGQTRKSFRDVRDVAVETFGRDGWAFSGETTSSVWYSRNLSPNWAMVLVLLPLGVVPALIYLVVAQRKQRAEVRWWSDGGRTSVEITVTPKGYGGQRISADLAAQLA